MMLKRMFCGIIETYIKENFGKYIKVNFKETRTNPYFIMLLTLQDINNVHYNKLCLQKY